MSAPALASVDFRRRNYGSGHTYTLDGVSAVGVTTALRNLAKPALTDAAAKVAAEYAVDEWETLSELARSERLALIAAAHKRKWYGKTVRGTRIHRFGELLVRGEPVEVPDELEAPVRAYAKFLERWELVAEHVELSVCNTRYRYAGTLDLIGTAPKLGRCQFDLKTGGVFPEAALQQSAYRHCDIALVDGRVDRMPAVEATYVIKIGPDDVELVPVDSGEATWKAFLYLVALHGWVQSTRDGDSTPIGRALNPEDL